MISPSTPSNNIYYFERGSGPTLLLLHGLMITGEMFNPVIDDLANHWRVIVPDLRGHGKSRGLPPPYTAAQLASDVAHLLDHLGIGSAMILGYSQGGAIAQQFVLDHPDRCSRLVLACTYAHNMASFRERIEGHLIPVLIKAMGMERFANLVISKGLNQVGKERAAWVKGLIASQDGRLMRIAWKEGLAFDSRSRLHEIHCPTLIIAGSKDEAVPIHHAKLLHEKIAGSKIQVIEGGDHAMIWDMPEEFIAVAENFLSA